MKVLFLLFLVFIPYSYSLQYITIGDTSLKNLTTSHYYNYFYILVPAYKYLHLVLLDDSYYIDDIYYCFTHSYSNPNESTIDSCDFFSLSYYDLKSTSSGKEYYYKKFTQPYYNCIIIRYSGGGSGTIKAGAAIAYMEEVDIDSTGIELPRTSNNDTYFYTKIYFKYDHDYVYFNLSDTSKTSYDFNTTLYCCLTNDDPKYFYLEAVRNCFFFPLYFNNTGKTDISYEYYYGLSIRNCDVDYVIVRYNYSSNYYSLYVESSYNEFKRESNEKILFIVTIVSIAIASLTFVGIIITIIWYYCRKRAVNNIPTASAPLVEKNNMHSPIN